MPSPRVRRRDCSSCICEPLPRRLLLAAGDADFTFSGDGRATLNFPGAPLLIADVAMTTNGKIIVGGTKGQNMAVARLNPDGSIDTTFGVGGLFESTRREEVTSVAIQGDGKIIVGLGSRTSFHRTDMQIGRLHANGSDFDGGFGLTGIATLGDYYNGSRVTDVAVQRDGKILAAGYVVSGTLTNDYDFGIARYNENGTIDTGFGGGNGVAENGFGGDETISAVTIDYNGTAGTNPLYGTIVAAGKNFVNGTETRFVLLRLRVDGTPDPAFSGDGKLISPDLSGAGGETAVDVVVQPGGKVVVAGTAYTSDPNLRNFLIARYTAAGTLDPTFGLEGAGGVTELDLGGRDEVGGIAVGYHDTQGNLVISGSRNGNFAAVALRPNGQLDTRFNFDGIVTTTIPGNASGLFATGSWFAPNRKLVFAGGNGQVARYIDVGSVITVNSSAPNMYEQGQQAGSFVVSRDQPLSFAETIVLATAGNATTRGATRDFDAVNIAFGNGVSTVTHVIIPPGATSISATLTPIDDAIVEGDETLTLTANTALSYDAGVPNSTTLVVRDNDISGGPVVTSASFAFETAPTRVRFSFNQSVAASISGADFQITGPPAIPSTAFSYDNITNTATLTFSSAPPNGNYSVRAIAAGITTGAGVPMPADHVLHFHVLAGDANRDRKVDVADLGILASNWQQSGRTFSQGDFNYDGKVDVADLGIFASNWQQELAAPSSPAPLGRRVARSHKLIHQVTL